MLISEKKSNLFTLQDDGSIWVKERSGNPHGGSAWKRWNNKREWDKGKPREGTYDKDGKRLRG